MAEIYKFFNSAPGDERWHYASDFADYFGGVLSNGILHTDRNVDLGLRTSVITGTLTTKVTTGKALIKGYAYENTTDLILTHDIPETTLKRIDRIVLRLDLTNSNRFMKLFVKKGVSATNPVAPDLQRDNYIHELSIAQVLVRENTTQLLESDLKDERMYEDLCGLVSSIISVPTTQFQEQWDTWFTSVQKEGFAPYNDTGYKEDLKTTNKTNIVAGINELKDDYVRSPGYATASGINAYAITLNPAPLKYTEGMGLVVKITNASTGSATINVNGLGAKSILKPNGLTVSNLKSNAVYSLRYNGVGFILQGEGGEEEQVVVTRNWNLLLSSYKVTYADDIYYYAVKDNVAYKILKSTMTIVATLPKINNSNYTVRSFMPGLKTEVYTGSAPTQNSYAYDENNTLIKSWDNYWYYYFVNATNSYIYKFYSGTSSYNYVEFTEWNWSNTLIRTLFKENGTFATDGAFVLKDNDSGILAIANKCIYKIDSLKSNIYTRYELGYSKATYHETLMSSAIAMTI